MHKEELFINTPPLYRLPWKHTYRVIPSKFPPINFFEDLIEPTLMEELFYIESLTNDRLREQVGDIFLVPKEDRVSGEGSSVVMAAFTHINFSNRFSDGSFGIYYAAKSLNTALIERSYHYKIFLSYTKEKEDVLTVRAYQSNKIVKPLRDIRSTNFMNFHHPDNYTSSQIFGLEMKNANEWGIVYNSVRDPAGECAAILRPPAIPLPVTQTKHYNLKWDGHEIVQAYEISGEVVSISYEHA